MKAFLPVLFLVCIGVFPVNAAEQTPEGERVLGVQMRDLFTLRGKPSPTAVELSGRHVELAGFLAPAPDEQSPFLVLVGAPTSFCPYCTTVDERDHLPFVLVYPSEEFDRTGLADNARVRVIGQMSASHGYEDTYGIHNDIRILSAEVVRDVRAVNPVRARLQAARAAASRSRSKETIGEN